MRIQSKLECTWMLLLQYAIGYILWPFTPEIWPNLKNREEFYGELHEKGKRKKGKMRGKGKKREKG